MNKDRRKRIDAALKDLGLITGKLEDLRNEIEAIRDEEQEAFDALPESFQEGDRGQVMQEAIDALEGALDGLDVDTDDVTSALEAAKGE